MFLTATLASLALISLAITLWQWLTARRFPLHQRVSDPDCSPAVTLLKPLKGCDTETAACLRSWLVQEYRGPIQVLFGVAAADDPVCEVVRALMRDHPQTDAQLIVCPESLGPNAKVSTLIQLQRQALHEVLIISDADVRVSRDFLANVVFPLRRPEVGLVNCLHSLANPTGIAMQVEAIAINADFWSLVLLGRSFKSLDFALGAVMAVRKEALDKIGGCEILVEYLADDYQLGNRVVNAGWRIEFCALVAECYEAPAAWGQVWQHQLRWERTVRVCQPLPYFFRIVCNATLWPLLWWLVHPTPDALLMVMICWMTRIITAQDLQQRLTRSKLHRRFWWLVPIRDLMHAVLWALAFLGSRVVWRGEQFRVLRGGKLVKSPGHYS